jgi:4-carboxymuconolactone decarboxylase
MKRMTLLALVMVAIAVGWLGRVVTAPYAAGKEPRFPQLTMDQLNDKQKPLGEQIMKVSSVGLGGPYNPMLRSPVLGQKMFDLL